jgi:hypothetical protein
MSHADSLRRNSIAALLLLLTVAPATRATDRAHKQAAKIVVQVQRADYEGDRAALKHLYEELSSFLGNKKLVSRARYWRGFALWRRAINGFNDHVASTELQEDLRQAVVEFQESASKDPAFVDAKVGELSCLGFLAYAIHQQDAKNAEIQDLIKRTRQLRQEIEATSPDNPRFLWVIGPMLWNIPPERGGGQTKAIEGYQKGLDTIRRHQPSGSDPLEPTWGEPELLMSLAWSDLNRPTPDPTVAEKYAQEALNLVPYWHYVRDILMPQIQNSIKTSQAKSGPSA